MAADAKAHARAQADLIRACLSGDYNTYDGGILEAEWIDSYPEDDYEDWKNRKFHFKKERAKWLRLKDTNAKRMVARSRKAHTIDPNTVRYGEDWTIRIDAFPRMLLVSDAIHAILAEKNEYRAAVSNQEISDKTDIDKGSVAKILKNLERVKWFSVTRSRRLGDAHIIMSLIEVTEDEVEVLSEADSIELPPVNPERVAKNAALKSRFRHWLDVINGRIRRTAEEVRTAFGDFTDVLTGMVNVRSEPLPAGESIPVNGKPSKAFLVRFLEKVTDAWRMENPMEYKTLMRECREWGLR